MKIHLSIVFALLSLSIFAQEETAPEISEKEFSEFVDELCGCTINGSDFIPEDLRRAMIEGALSGATIEEVMETRRELNTENLMKDAEGLIKFGESMSKCTEKLGNKYESLFEDVQSEEIAQRMLELMKDESGCEFGYALVLLGRNAANVEETYYDEEYYDEEYYEEEE